MFNIVTPSHGWEYIPHDVHRNKIQTITIENFFIIFILKQKYKIKISKRKIKQQQFCNILRLFLQNDKITQS